MAFLAGLVGGGGRVVLPWPHGPRWGPLARHTSLTQHLTAEGDLIRAVPSAVSRERSRRERQSWSYGGPNDQGCPSNPSVRRQYPYPGCRMRGVHARLVKVSAVNAAHAFPRSPRGRALLLGPARASRPLLRCYWSRRRHVLPGCRSFFRWWAGPGRTSA